MIEFHRFKFVRPVFLARCGVQSIGFARISSSKSGEDAQIAELEAHGCASVFTELTDGTAKDKNMLRYQAAVDNLKEGDELVIVKLDRLGRTSTEVMSNLQQLQTRGIHLKTLDGLVDTKKLGDYGQTLINLLKGILEVERSIINERNLEKYEKRKGTGGNIGGRPRTNPAKESLVIRLREEGSSYRSIRSQTGLALSTIRRIILENQA